MKGRKNKGCCEKRPVSAAVSRLLELPEYSMGQSSRIELNSNREAVVENCRGILEYTPERIRLLTPKMTVRFIGRGLLLGSMNKCGVVVRGNIEGLEFSSLG